MAAVEITHLFKLKMFQFDLKWSIWPYFAIYKY